MTPRTFRYSASSHSYILIKGYLDWTLQPATALVYCPTHPLIDFKSGTQARSKLSHHVDRHHSNLCCLQETTGHLLPTTTDQNYPQTSLAMNSHRTNILLNEKVHLHSIAHELFRNCNNFPTASHSHSSISSILKQRPFLPSRTLPGPTIPSLPSLFKITKLGGLECSPTGHVPRTRPLSRHLFGS